MLQDITQLAPFRRVRAADVGLDEPAIRRALRSGELVARRRGVLVGGLRADMATGRRSRHALDIQIALAGLRGVPAAACLGSAGLLHGLTRLGRDPERVRLYRPSGGPWRDDCVAVLVCSLPAHHLTVFDDAPATTLSRTAVDLGRWVTFRSGVVVMDSAIRLGCTRAQLQSVARDCARWPGVRKAREAIAFADGRAASPLESVSRVVFRELGLPEPELQVALAWDEFGNPRIVVDFYWPEFGVVGEADGLIKYDEELDPKGNSLRAEKLRQEELEGLGYIVVRWTWEQIWRTPDWVAARIRAAMAEGARRRRTA